MTVDFRRIQLHEWIPRHFHASPWHRRLLLSKAIGSPASLVFIIIIIIIIIILE